VKRGRAGDDDEHSCRAVKSLRTADPGPTKSMIHHSAKKLFCISRVERAVAVCGVAASPRTENAVRDPNRAGFQPSLIVWQERSPHSALPTGAIGDSEL